MNESVVSQWHEVHTVQHDSNCDDSNQRGSRRRDEWSRKGRIKWFETEGLFPKPVMVRRCGSLTAVTPPMRFSVFTYNPTSSLSRFNLRAMLFLFLCMFIAPSLPSSSFVLLSSLAQCFFRPLHRLPLLCCLDDIFEELQRPHDVFVLRKRRWEMEKQTQEEVHPTITI